MTRGVDDALAWIAKQPAEKTCAGMDETLALAAARLLAGEVVHLRGTVEFVREELAQAHAEWAPAAARMLADQTEIAQLRLQQAALQKICRIENAETRRLIGEVERLEGILCEKDFEISRQRCEIVLAEAELARYRAAPPGIIACAHGEAATCARDPFGWGICCLIRRRMIAAGLLPAVEKAAMRGSVR